MSSNPDLPDDVYEAVQVIRELRTKPYLSRADRETINRAKLRVAFWACRTESIPATRDNLTYVLGPDAADIMNAYDKYLQRDDGPAPGSGSGGPGSGPRPDQFWGQ